MTICTARLPVSEDSGNNANFAKIGIGKIGSPSRVVNYDIFPFDRYL